MADTDKKTGGQVLEKTRPKITRPDLYKVVLHNDDYTTMEFVVMVLEVIFDKSPAEAHHIMMQVHLGGRGVCGLYPHEVAETKAVQVVGVARRAGYPLLCTVEEE